MTRFEAVNELKALWKVLDADLAEAVTYGQSNNSPYAQRALVRAHFALIEGLSFALRQVTLASLRGTERLSEDEVILLREERPSIDEQGRPKAIQQFLKFPDSLLFSIRSYVKNHGTTYEPDRTGSGWQALHSAVKARDRVTHPKSAASLALSDADLRTFVEAAAWWKKTMLEMFGACDEADEYWKKTLAQRNSSEAG
jgi:hypothetical protein